ncbi:chaperone protein DnaJ [Herpetosiphon gulosus]|uniref:Chaperone protein DnaJ n=1 Tax=Herpetosiphon gulosus TaxID=1973496 RepID=A0ABP9X0E4_9CHLR
MKTHYEVLGVASNADAATIDAAFRRLARQYHPDINKAPDATALMQALNIAYGVLKDAQKRQAYDRELSGQRDQPQQRQQSSGNAINDLFAVAWHAAHPAVYLYENHTVEIAGNSFRFDFAYPAQKIGIICQASASSQATWADWQVIQLTAQQIMSNPMAAAEAAYQALAETAYASTNPTEYAAAQTELRWAEEWLEKYDQAQVNGEDFEEQIRTSLAPQYKPMLDLALVGGVGAIVATTVVGAIIKLALVGFIAMVVGALLAVHFVPNLIQAWSDDLRIKVFGGSAGVCLLLLLVLHGGSAIGLVVGASLIGGLVGYVYAMRQQAKV